MSNDIGTRLQQAIRAEEESAAEQLRALHESDRVAEQQFEPVMQAAEDLRQELAPVPSIEVAVNPDSVWITLADRELRFSYDLGSQRFVGEESAHSWHDGETYFDRREWDTADACIEAMIRLCAKYVRMARAISRPAGTD